MVIDASNMSEEELEDVLGSILDDFSEYEGMYGWQLLEYGTHLRDGRQTREQLVAQGGLGGAPVKQKSHEHTTPHG